MAAVLKEMKQISDSVKKAVSDSLTASGVDEAVMKKVLAHLSKDGLPSVMNRTKSAFLTVSEDLHAHPASRDKDAPRARMSAYNLFGSDVRAKKLTWKDFDAKHATAKTVKTLLTKINTDHTYKMALQDVATLWPAITAETRAKYQEASLKDKERYDREMQAYVPPSSAIATLPKPPAKSAMDLWIREQMDDDSNHTRAEWREKWFALSDEARSDATIHFAKKNMEFIELTQLFHESFPEESAVLKRKQEMIAGAPSKPKSAYLFFSMDHMKSIKKDGMTLPEVSRQVASAWTELNEAAKKPYEKKAEEDKERYQREVMMYEKGEWISPKVQEVKKRHDLQAASIFFTRSLKKQWKAEGKHASNPELKSDGKAIHTLAMAEWKALTPEQCQTWVDKWKMSLSSLPSSSLDVSNLPSETDVLSSSSSSSSSPPSKKSKVNASKK